MSGINSPVLGLVPVAQIELRSAPMLTLPVLRMRSRVPPTVMCDNAGYCEEGVEKGSGACLWCGRERVDTASHGGL